MREIIKARPAHLEEVGDVKQRLTTIAKRLEAHNRLEEEEAYMWPSVLLDEQTVVELCGHIRHELETLPQRFTVSHQRASQK